jgi:uncharacterized protein with HEPN domain
MRKDDRIRLQHMLDAGRDARAFAEGRTRSDLDGNRMLVLSLVKSLEILGEAAARVSQGCRDSAPDVPWAAIVGMRNRLIHGYYDVDLDRVWDTIHDDLPPLVASLERFLRSSDED